MKYYEVNFDGQIAPSHEFAGLSEGNIASTQHKGLSANYHKALKQWQAKVELITSLGIKQYKLPLLQRPDPELLANLGLSIQDLSRPNVCPSQLRSALISASAMWAANAASITPSCDSLDSKVHITPANLAHFFHRAIETRQTQANLKKVFCSEFFIHHPPLPNHSWFYDEGSANHLRICPNYDTSALNIFVYGHDAFAEKQPELKFPSRQSLQSCQTIARNHMLRPDNTLFVQQSAKAINAGVFHNDVIAVANLNVLFYHQLAFTDTTEVIKQIQAQYQRNYPNSRFYPIEVTSNDLTLQQAVSSYIFNSQLVTVNSAKNQYMALIAPCECKTDPAVQNVLNKILAEDNPIERVYYVDLSESMANGGGPACLRLKVVLSEAELASLNLQGYEV
ncbi:succinylarginine dihydrolase [Catenovulum agarivorans DS-2]|uniref:Succinylarginine dihydrolase n=1 Tax=Catenovulum agarivorans DS-2 TaxID=1328313 RepID=W7QTK8_9ALTE|nr:N-succinylarginine dihydrolase [Catenovulum agarivorans]EWH12362.1 succinylarginine dihydrolase [Catenovulum agarivorans DS-2]